MNEPDAFVRNVLLGMSWFPPDTEILGIPTRSLSLASHQWVRQMGLRILDPGADLSPSEEIAQLNAYVWAHSVDPATVSALAWTGDWREALDYEEESEAATLAALGEWRAIRQIIVELLEATEIRVIPRPRKGTDDTPSDVVGLLKFSHQVTTCMRETGLPRQEVLWHLPKWEANQIYHGALRRDGAWTAPDLRRSAPDDFQDFALGGLDDGEEDDHGRA